MALKETFRRGDDVVHRSGGPMMIATMVDGNVVSCEWIENGRKRTESFDAVALIHYRRDSEDWESLEASSDFMTS